MIMRFQKILQGSLNFQMGRNSGIKTANVIEMMDQLDWNPPDWIVVPGGNLGNVSAFGKAFFELKELGLIDRMPRLALINAAGADTFYQLYEKSGVRWHGGKPDQPKINAYMKYLDDADRRADTLASAIEINRPVNLPNRGQPGPSRIRSRRKTARLRCRRFVECRSRPSRRNAGRA